MGVPAAKKSGTAIAERMKAMPVNDDASRAASARTDVAYSAYLFEVKKPAESKGPVGLLKLVATTPVDEAWRPLGDGDCYYIGSEPAGRIATHDHDLRQAAAAALRAC